MLAIALHARRPLKIYIYKTDPNNFYHKEKTHSVSRHFFNVHMRLKKKNRDVIHANNSQTALIRTAAPSGLCLLASGSMGRFSEKVSLKSTIY
jgi:hypothetical protein